MGNEHIRTGPDGIQGAIPQRCQIAPVLGKHGITSMPAEHIIFRQRGLYRLLRAANKRRQLGRVFSLDHHTVRNGLLHGLGQLFLGLGVNMDQFDHVPPIGKGLVQLPLAKDHPHLALRLTEAGICCLRKVIDDPFTCKPLAKPVEPHMIGLPKDQIQRRIPLNLRSGNLHGKIPLNIRTGLQGHTDPIAGVAHAAALCHVLGLKAGIILPDHFLITGKAAGADNDPLRRDMDLRAVLLFTNCARVILCQLLAPGMGQQCDAMLQAELFQTPDHHAARIFLCAGNMEHLRGLVGGMVHHITEVHALVHEPRDGVAALVQKPPHQPSIDLPVRILHAPGKDLIGIRKDQPLPLEHAVYRKNAPGKQAVAPYCRHGLRHDNPGTLLCRCGSRRQTRCAAADHQQLCCILFHLCLLIPSARQASVRRSISVYSVAGISPNCNQIPQKTCDFGKKGTHAIQSCAASLNSVIPAYAVRYTVRNTVRPWRAAPYGCRTR